MSKFVALTDALYDYLLAHSLRDHPVLQKLRAETSALPNAQMQIGPDQGQFFQWLVEVLGAKKTLEVGVFTGYSSLVVALALPPDGRIVACDISEEYTTIARRYWREAGVEAKVDLRLGPAVATLYKLIAEGQAGTFDFAFIDADKPAYPDYYERCLTLVRRGGVIAVDNVLQHGRVADPSNREENTAAIRAFNQKLHHDERITLSLVAIADGISLCRKR